MDEMSNGLKITIAICIVVGFVSVVAALAVGVSIANRQHNQLIQTCISQGGQWINGSCIRSSR